MFLRVKNKETGEWENIRIIKGDKPVKGVDYFTEEEKQEMIDEIISLITKGN